MAHDLSNICHGTGSQADLISIGAAIAGLTRDGVTLAATLETNFVADNADGCAVAQAAYHTRRGFRLSGTRLELVLDNIMDDWAQAAPAVGVAKLSGGFAATQVAILVYGGATGTDTLRTLSIPKAVAVDPGDWTWHETSEHESGFAYEAIWSTAAGDADEEFGTITDTAAV